MEARHHRHGVRRTGLAGIRRIGRLALGVGVRLDREDQEVVLVDLDVRAETEVEHHALVAVVSSHFQSASRP